MSDQPILRIGTRGSKLALIQTEQVRRGLAANHPDLGAPGAIEVRVIKTSGDQITDRPLAEVGGKGLFAKELETALQAGEIDLAVHSMKDVETWLPEGLEVSCLLPREDPREALIAGRARRLDDLPNGATFGTASLRRQAQLLERRPDLNVVLLRGNVQTRLEKVARGEVAGTFLAVAGLRRLGLGDIDMSVIETADLLPAVAQGAVGVEHRADDDRVRAYLAPLNDAATYARVAAERAMLAGLDGSCRTPIAGLAHLDGDLMSLSGLIARPDGSAVYRAARSGPADDPEALGRAVADDLLSQAGRNFLKMLG